jgi:hypothetical protein
MPYATPEELRAHINKSSTDDDVSVLTPLLSAAETTINRFCNRPDGFLADTVACARRYAGSGKPYQFIDENVSITLVEVKNAPTSDTYDSWATTDWIAAKGEPNYPNYNALPYDLLIVDPTGDEEIFYSGLYTTRGGFRPVTEISRGVPTVRITALWGFAVSTPDTIKEACIMQSARWYKRLEGAMADALASGELGSLLYRQSLDPDIKTILVKGRYVKPTTGRR